MKLQENSLICIFICIISALLESTALTKDEVAADPVYDKYEEMVELSGGKFTMGTNAANGRDGENVQRKATVKPFKINKYPITNAAFRLLSLLDD